ncbi:MAG: T9SS type A sorting domain-containing protein, partial [Chlorobi bacterium]|nr:T9SS type A sorting domain-containing protein [Chlorobiota bacterium]
SANETLSFTGTLLTGNQSIAVTFTSPNTFEGYNLVGNPYPSAFDWEDDANVTKTNINDELWYRTAGTFATYSGVSGFGTNGGQRYIPAGQGFWVKATAAGTFGVSNGARVHNDTTAFYKTDNNSPLLSLTAVNGEYADETILAFMPGSEPGFDAYDTEKMFATDDNYPQVWYQANDELVAVNVLPEMEETMSFPLGFRAKIAGEYTINVTRFENIAENTKFTLEDLNTETIVNLSDNASYTFNSEIVDNNSRFVVHITKTSATNSSVLNENNIRIFAYLNKITIQNAGDASIEVYNVLGKLVKKDVISSSEFHQISLNNATGYYFVKVITQNGIETQKVFIKQ